MSSNPKTLKIAGFIAMMIAAGILIGWFASRGAKSPPQPPTPPGDPSVPTHTNGTLSTPNHTRNPTMVSNEPPGDVSETDTNAITKWEEKVDAVIRDKSEDDVKARKLLEIFPRLPEDGQIEAAKHIANLISDEDYPKLARYLADPSTSSEVLDDLMADLLNRPNSTKLPTLLEIARNPQHPKAADAREILVLYLDDDYGDNWKQWEEKLAEWLKDNPD